MKDYNRIEMDREEVEASIQKALGFPVSLLTLHAKGATLEKL